MNPIDKLLERLSDARRSANGYTARCPAHDDRKASLCFSAGDDGRALMYCQAGCDLGNICDAMGIAVADLFPHNGSSNGVTGPHIVETYQYLDIDSTILFETVRFEPKDFRQRRLDSNGRWIWSIKGVKRVLYRLPQLAAADRAQRTFICEGEKDCDNLHALGLLATTCPMGAGKWKHLDADSVLEGRLITIIADKDEAGHRHAKDVAKRLYGRASEVRILELPGDGKDASDWLAAGGSKEALLTLAAEAPLFSPSKKQAAAKSEHGDSSSSPAPEVILGTDEHRVIDEVSAALAGDTDLYQRAGLLVRAEKRRVRMGQHFYTCSSIGLLPRPNLRERITRCVSLFRVDEDGDLKAAHPPQWLVGGVEARGRWQQLRELTAVSTIPILRPDGTIVQVPGYDSATGVLYQPIHEFPLIHNEVDCDDADAAIEQLLDVIQDFRFAGPEHRSAFLAALLTPLARHAFDGPAPLFLFDANVRGAGKGLLADVIGYIVDGHPMPTSSYSHEPEEMRKKITSIALAGDLMTLLDNIAGAFGNDAIDRALTSTRWKDRLLKTNSMTDLPLQTTWYGTGNNVVVGADTVRRIIHVRLDVLEERPEERSDFKHPNLRAWVREIRPRLLTAALTILRAFFRAGRPQQALRTFGSYEGWSDLIRQALVWCGQPDPCLTRVTLMESSDVMAAILVDLHTGWAGCFGDRDVTLAHVLDTIYSETPWTDPAMQESVRRLAGAIESLVNLQHGKRATPTQLGNRLKALQRRVIDGRMLDVDRESGRSRHGAKWRLFLAKGDAGDSGDAVSGVAEHSREELP